VDDEKLFLSSITAAVVLKSRGRKPLLVPDTQRLLCSLPYDGNVLLRSTFVERCLPTPAEKPVAVKRRDISWLAQLI
jgi:hypothetical protein